MEQAERAAVRQGLAVSLAVSLDGVTFGALAVAAGLDVWQACVLSLVMFTGGSQFAFVGIIASGGVAAAPAGVIAALLLGLRNTVYAMRLSSIVGRGVLRRLGAAQLTIDESIAVAVTQDEPRAQRVGFWATGIAIFIGWNVATLAGALVGNLIGDVRDYGLDAAAACAFLALLWPRLRSRQAVAVGVGAAVVATVATPFVMPGMQVLLAAIVAIIVGVFNLFAGGDTPFSGGNTRAVAR
ncbi:AzlC family ABC transporter permease [Microbacterium sp. ZW T5_56]|uniref:AzlC family ABC transporter permease n=1 Tax=Microbacterium sp. ZW T5_56 TaxID=3378081 RepID=UPI003854EDD8